VFGWENRDRIWRSAVELRSGIVDHSCLMGFVPSANLKCQAACPDTATCWEWQERLNQIPIIFSVMYNSSKFTSPVCRCLVKLVFCFLFAQKNAVVLGVICWWLWCPQRTLVLLTNSSAHLIPHIKDPIACTTYQSIEYRRTFDVPACIHTF
jgi:hypothetical protein